MEGRRYKLRRKRRVNYFTYLEYGDLCKDIKSANPVFSSVLVKVTDGKFNLAPTIDDVVSNNGKERAYWGKETDKPLKAGSYNKHLGRNDTIRFVYPNDLSARRAADIINKMAFPDSIDPKKIKTDGSVVTKQGLTVNVELAYGKDGTPLAESEGTYVGGTTADLASSAETEKSSPNWYLVGGAVVIGVVLILAIIGKMKK